VPLTTCPHRAPFLLPNQLSVPNLRSTSPFLHPNYNPTHPALAFSLPSTYSQANHNNPQHH